MNAFCGVTSSWARISKSASEIIPMFDDTLVEGTYHIFRVKITK